MNDTPSTSPIPKNIQWALGVALVLLAISFLPLARVLLLPDVVFAFNDGNIEGLISPSHHYPELLFRNWNNQFFFGQSGGAAPLTSWTLLESVLGPHHYRRIGVLLAIWFTGLAFYWTLRQFQRSRWAAALGALLIMLSGWNLTFPMNGLGGRSFTLAWAALSLGMLERGRRSGSWLAYAVAGGILGLAVSDTPDVGILFSVCCAAFFVFKHFQGKKDFLPPTLIKHGARFVLYVACSVFIAFQMMQTVFSTQISGVSQGAGESPEAKYAWATQWSLPKAETWSLVASDFHGASSRSAKSPYWGGMGRSEGWEETKQGFRNFRLAGYALGVVPVAFLVLLYVYLIRRRQEDLLDDQTRWESWMALGLLLLSLMLSWGKHFPLYRLFYALPYMGTIRNPDKWLGPFTLFFCLAFAIGVDLVIRLNREENRALNKSLLKVGGLVLLIIPVMAMINFVLLSRNRFLSRLQAEGYGEMAEKAWNNALNTNLLVLVLLGAGFTLLWVLLAYQKGSHPAWRQGVLVGIAILVSADLLRAGAPFVELHRYKHVLDANPLTRYLDAHRNEGYSKLIPPSHPLLNNWRMTYFRAKGYDLFDPVSVSRMPTDYQQLFDALSKNPARLWRLGSVKYFLCLANVLPELQKLNSEKGAFVERLALGAANWEGNILPSTSVPDEHKLLKVVEYTGALPPFRFAVTGRVFPDSEEGSRRVLETLTDPAFDPGSTVLLQGSVRETGSTFSQGTVEVLTNNAARASLKVSLPGKGLLVRSVKHHPDWKVLVDGAPAELLQANYLFQAVEVPAGLHQIEFLFDPSRSGLQFSLLGRFFMVALIVILGIQGWRSLKHASS